MKARHLIAAFFAGWIATCIVFYFAAAFIQADLAWTSDIMNWPRSERMIFLLFALVTVLGGLACAAISLDVAAYRKDMGHA